MESSPSSSRIEGGSRKCIIASALIFFFASVAVFQFSLINNNLTIADVIGATDETRRLQIASTPHGFGEFYVTMYVGDPPQAQRLQVVTNVDYTTMICEDCYHCGTSHFDSPFNPVASSTAQYAQCGKCLDPEARCMQTTNQCLLTSHFMGSLASAVEVYDQVLIDYTSKTISETIPTNLAQHGLGLKFQCANFLDSQAELTKSVADGYLSMSTAKTSFLQQLFDAGGITKRVFSMCFRDAQQKYQPAGASAGTLLLGAIMNPNRFKTPLVYARNSAAQVNGMPSGYFINVRRVYLALGAQSDTLMRVSQSALGMLPIENAAGRSMDMYNRVNGATGNVGVEINKPYTLLHRDLMVSFTASFLNVTGLIYDRKGIPMTPAQFKQLPTIILQLEASDSEHVGGYVLVGVPGLIGEFDPVHPMDILLAIPPQHYLIYDARKKIATPSVIFDTTVSFIGSNVLQGHQVVFDIDQVRIGFAEQECTAGLSLVISDTEGLVISDTEGSSTSHSHTRGGDATGRGNNTSSAAAGNNFTSQLPLDGVSVSSDQGPSTTTTTSSIGGARSSSIGQEWNDGGASAQKGFVSSSEAGNQVLSSIAASTTDSEGANTVTTASTTSGSSNTVTTPMGLPKPSDTENQSMRYGPAVTSPYSYARSQADASSVKTASSSSSQTPNHRTGGSDLLWYLMAGTAFLMGFGLTVAGTRAENAVPAGPQWGRGDVRADDGLSVFDANTTVYGGRKQAYGSSGKSVMGGNKSVYGGKSVSGGKSVMGGNRSVAGGIRSGNRSVAGGNRSVVGSKQAYEAPPAKKQVYEGPTATKQVYEGPTATKQVYEGPTATKQVYEGPTATKQVYEGPTATKQVYEGPGSEHNKTVSTTKEPGIFSKGIFGGGKKKKEVANDGGTVATGWSQGSGSFFSRAQSKASTKKNRMGGKEAARDDVTTFTYGSQSYYGHNLD